MKHLSALDLDQLASGLGPVAAAVEAHAGVCVQCQGRLAALRAEAEAVRRMPGFAQGQATTQAATRAPSPVRWAPRFWLVLPVAAAAAAIWLVRPGSLAESPPAALTERLKGSVAVGLVDARGHRLSSPLHPGDEVQLAADAHGHPHGLIWVVDDEQITRLWPASDSRLTPDRPRFRVTPGSLILFAFFGDDPLSATEARAALEAAVARCPRPLQSECLAPEVLTGESARARADFRVE